MAGIISLAGSNRRLPFNSLPYSFIKILKSKPGLRLREVLHFDSMKKGKRIWSVPLNLKGWPAKTADIKDGNLSDSARPWFR
jgi:hypothetical protein